MIIFTERIHEAVLSVDRLPLLSMENSYGGRLPVEQKNRRESGDSLSENHVRIWWNALILAILLWRYTALHLRASHGSLWKWTPSAGDRAMPVHGSWLTGEFPVSRSVYRIDCFETVQYGPGTSSPWTVGRKIKNSSPRYALWYPKSERFLQHGPTLLTPVRHPVMPTGIIDQFKIINVDD